MYHYFNDVHSGAKLNEDVTVRLERAVPQGARRPYRGAEASAAIVSAWDVMLDNIPRPDEEASGPSQLCKDGLAIVIGVHA